MNIKAIGAAIALFSGLGICAATPAKADITTNGVFLYQDEDGDTGTWTISTTCSPDCVAHVTTSPGRGFDAALIDGRYTNTRSIPDAVTCPGHTAGDFGRWIPSSSHAINVTQWWDPQTLAGEVDFHDHDGPCALGDRSDHFTLTRMN